MWILPLLAVLIVLFTAGAVSRLYLSRRQPAFLVWSFSLGLLAIALACVFLASIDVWTALLAKTYYLAAIVSFAAFMSAGTVYFNTPKIIAHIWLAVLALASLVAVVLLAGSPVDALELSHNEAPGWRSIDVSQALLGLATAMSSIGIVILVVAAAYSFVYHRAGTAQVLVAAGVLTAVASGSLYRLDDYQWASLGQALGALVIFAGINRLTAFREE
jgi:hypothetical protein